VTPISTLWSIPLCPSTDYLEHSGDPTVRAIVRKHETLSGTNQKLIRKLVILSDDYKKNQHDLETLLWEHDNTKIVMLLSMLFMVYRAVFRSTESHHLQILFFGVLNGMFLQEILRPQTHIQQLKRGTCLQLLLTVNIKYIPLV